jgi:preprotein translocase subunit SecD
MPMVVRFISLTSILIVTIAGCQKRPLAEFTPSGPPSVELEIRLASDTSGEGTTPVSDPDTKGTLHLGAAIEFTNRDIERTRVFFEPDEHFPISRVLIRLNRDAGERLARLTKDNEGRRLAILLDRKVVMAPIIRGEIKGGEAEISGSFSKDEAISMAKGLVGRE